MSTNSAVLEWGHERVRVGRWRTDAPVALLSPAADAPLPTAAFLQRCLLSLAEEGYTTVLTAALAPSEQPPFRAAGFYEQERLRLMSHDLRHLQSVPPVAMRRGVDTDRPAVLAVDELCFSPFWQLDEMALQDAIEATPATRFQVGLGATPEDGPGLRGPNAVAGLRGPNAVAGLRGPNAVVAYAVCGRTHRRGYVQRLAVHPSWRGRGFGRALVLDGLRWMHRKGAERAVVNTQLENHAAHRLYLRLGFREEPGGLAVLRQDLG